MISRTSRGPDYALLALVSALTVFGLVMVYSASFMIAVNEGHSQVYYLVRQSVWAILGGGLLLVGQRIDYRWWRKLALPLMGITLLLLIAVILLPESMTKRGGAERWITFGPIGIQPTEIAKFSLVIYLSSWLRGRGPKLRSMTISLIPIGSGLILGGSLGYVLMRTAAYRLERFLVYKDPWKYARDGGFQPIHAM